jgi:hypothetical protein
MDIEKLKAAAEKCTALNLDSAEFERGDDNCIDCPICGGEGYVYLEGDYCNIDDVALGVQFYGIGNHHKAAEEYFRIALPANIIALCDELATLRQYKAEAESQEPTKWERLDKNFSTEDSDVAAKWEEKQLPVRKLYARPVPAGSCAVPEWENEAKRAFWCGLEIGAGMGSVKILPRWNEYIAKRKSELSAIPSNSEGEKS